jgi:hypothetical protein
MPTCRGDSMSAPLMLTSPITVTIHSLQIVIVVVDVRIPMPWRARQSIISRAGPDGSSIPKVEQRAAGGDVAALVGAGQARAADELRGHVAALEEELMVQSQYDEEFLIPEMEGRPIGRWSAVGRGKAR